MPIRKLLRKGLLWVLKNPEEQPESTKPKPPAGIRLVPDLRGRETTRLVLASVLHIHDSICDADAWQGYEGTPEQVEKILWQVYGILSMHPEVTDTQEVHDIWLDDYAMAEVQQEMGWQPGD